MTEFQQLSPVELFTRTLQLFKKPDDFLYRGDNVSSYERDFKNYMHELFSNLERGKDPVKRDKLVQLVSLRDQHGLSILGYILLLGKYGGLYHLYSYVKNDDEIQNIISSRLNSELASVLTYYSSDINKLIEYIIVIKRYVPSFKLSVENVKLIGYMMAIKVLVVVFELPNMSRPIEIPNQFVPYVEPPPLPPPPSQQFPSPPSQQFPPPPPPLSYSLLGPPSHPPPLHYPHLFSYSQPPPPPPPYSNGGTRKNHKRHKKQMRKHASKKSKHA